MQSAGEESTYSSAHNKVASSPDDCNNNSCAVWPLWSTPPRRTCCAESPLRGPASLRPELLPLRWRTPRDSPVPARRKSPASRKFTSRLVSCRSRTWARMYCSQAGGMESTMSKKSCLRRRIYGSRSRRRRLGSMEAKELAPGVRKIRRKNRKTDSPL